MRDISARELKGHNILAVERFWDQGRIEATGTHEELLKKCPLYKEMWQAHIGSRDEGGATA